jgi:rubredoxin
MGSAIRGSRVGAGPMGEAERGESIERFHVSYWCGKGHEVKPSFAKGEGVEIPAEWDCPKCGLPAGLDKNNPPSAVKNEPYKTTWPTLKNVVAKLKVKRFWLMLCVNYTEMMTNN